MWNVQISIAAIIIVVGLVVSAGGGGGRDNVGQMIALAGAVAGGWLLKSDADHSVPAHRDAAILRE